MSNTQRSPNGPSVQESRASRLLYLFEDDPVQAQLLSTQIGYYGYSVQPFTELAQLVATLDREMPAAILMDVIFPEGDIAGPEAIMDLRRAHGLAVPVLFLSARGGFAARVQAVRAGGDAYFTKPVDVGALVDTLDRLLVHGKAESMRVLIVDDSVLQANVNAMHLKRAGMQTVIISEPTQIIEILEQFSPELILLDMYMPDCSGMELAQIIRQMAPFVSVPIVYLSSETDREIQIEAVGLGGDDFLVKPIRPGHLVAAVTSRIERYRQLRTLMLHDSLTGLLNHITAKERLSQEVERARRTGTELCFVMLDIDDFKEVNDHYGHPAGDRVLKSLSQLLTGRLRKSDIIGRYGGEEFAVVLPNTSLNGAVTLMDELRQAFAHLRHRSGAQEFSVTFSCGVGRSARDDSAASLIVAADDALYRAKAEGKNRVCAAH